MTSPKILKRGTLKAFLATAAALPFTVIAHANEDIPHEPTIAKGTMVLSSEQPQTDSSGAVSFVIKVNELSFSEKLRLLSTKRTALIFDGGDKKSNRLCPFFNLQTRDYKIREITPNVYRVTTNVTVNEDASVRAAGCAVTTPPDRRKIEYLN
jgi:hypothetical protein